MPLQGKLGATPPAPATAGGDPNAPAAPDASATAGETVPPGTTAKQLENGDVEVTLPSGQKIIKKKGSW